MSSIDRYLVKAKLSSIAIDALLTLYSLSLVFFEQNHFEMTKYFFQQVDTKPKLFKLLRSPDFICRENGVTERFSCKLIKFDSASSEGTTKVGGQVK